MQQLIKQVINLMRQNPFHTVVSIVGTAVTIAFVMVVVMIYDFRTADIAPETERSRLMYTDQGMTYRKQDHTNQNRGIGPVAFEALFTDVKGVKEVTWYRGVSKTPCCLPASETTFNYFVRPVAVNWFSFFSYDFIAGRSFTQEEYDANRWACVITERMARQLFGTTDVVGKEFLVNFFPAKVVGVVRDVNAIFQTAYADCFMPYSIENEDNYVRWTSGLGGIRLGILKLEAETDPNEIRKEVQRREENLNKNAGYEYNFELGGLYTHTEYTFFRDKSISASLVYGLLILMLLIVPAINISGMTHAQMQGRLTELSVRKAYGASNVSLLGRLFAENLVTTWLGGILGYILSCLLMWLGRVWLLGNGGVELSNINVDGGLMLRPFLFLIVFVVCIVFNLLSVLLPAWIATRRDIASTIKGE